MPNKLSATILLSSLIAVLHAQAPNPAEEKTVKTPQQVAFSNLSKEKRDEYVKHRSEALRLLSEKRIIDCIVKLDEASKIFTDDVELLGYYGSCWLELRDFDKARQYYDKGAELDPKHPSIAFNRGELNFVVKNWQESINEMNRYITLIGDKDLMLSRLAEYKILLANIALGNDEEVDKLANKYDPIKDDTPYYYYAKAALCFKDKEDEAAAKWILSAIRVFENVKVIEIWQDTLIEYGYLKGRVDGKNKAGE